MIRQKCCYIETTLCELCFSSFAFYEKQASIACSSLEEDFCLSCHKFLYYDQTPQKIKTLFFKLKYSFINFIALLNRFLMKGLIGVSATNALTTLAKAHIWGQTNFLQSKAKITKYSTK